MLDNGQLKTLGERIKAFRQKANLSQEEVAEKLGNATVSSISKLENGNMGRQPAVGKLIQLAEILNCTLTDLVQEYDNGSTENSQS